MQSQLHYKYGLNEKTLSVFYDLLVKFVENNGGIIKYVSLEKVIETEIYDVNPELLKGVDHHETAISNGLEIFLHDDLDEVGFEARIYDLLHVGLGHFWQWNAGVESDLKFYDDIAWEFANKFYLGSPDTEIAKVRAYEEEAGTIALSLARKILKDASHIMPVHREALLRFYNDYLLTDLDYITHFYKSGELPEIETVWKYSTIMLPEIYVDFSINPRKRDGKCIPLVSKHRNLYKKH